MPFEITHYKPKKIAHITKTDSKIAIVGKVLDLGDNSFTIGDETGKMEIVSDNPIEKDSLIRTFCSRVENQLVADVIQDLKGLDLNLFKKVEELYIKAGV